MKKLFTLLLALIASAGMMYASVEINGIAYIFNETDRTADVTSKSPMYSGDVIIPSSVTYNGINYNVTSIGGFLGHAFQNCTGLTSVTIGDRVTSIGDGAFNGCTGLRTINIPDNVQQLGWRTFIGCTGLESVTIGSGVKKLDGTFSDCTGLTSITIPNTVDTIIEPFSGCANLTAIHISDLSHWCSTVFYSSTTDGYKYYNSIFLQHIHLFVNGTEIIDLVIPDGITDIADGAFYGSVISSVTIPNSVTSIGNYAFYGCSGLTSVTIGNSVTSIGRDAFYGCSRLTDVTIPNSVTSIGDYAFRNCSSLTSVTIPNSVTSIGDMAFYNIPNIIYQGIAEGAPWGARSVNGYVDGWLIYKDDTKTELLACLPEATGEITIPNSVTTIGHNAFYGCEGITNVFIPESVTTIDGGAFSGCTGLPVINNIRYADSYLVEAVDKTLTTYTLKDGIKWIGEYAFSGCTNMTSFAIPDGIKTIEFGTFQECNSLNSVTIPNSVKTIYSYAFYRCLGLDSIVIPAGVDTIEAQAFERCNNLTTVTINSNAVAGANYPIPDQGYGFISGLINIFGAQVENYIFGEGVTKIGERAFYSNYSKSVTAVVLGKLSQITIPSSVTTIGEQAFYRCPLPFLYIPETVTSIGNDAFKDMKMVAYKGNATGAPWGATCYNEWCGNSSLPVTTWIDITDNSLSDWDELPADYVYTATCPNDAFGEGLKSVKVFVDPTYINLLVTPNMEVIKDLEWVPFHIFIDADNSDLTGGSSYPFADANADLLLEGGIFSEGKTYSYSPAVYPWYGEVGGEDWNWTNDALECWGALVCEGELQDCGSQYVDGKFEIKINRNNIPFNWNENMFGIGCGILQNWDYVGFLPAVSPTDQNHNGVTNKLKVKKYNNSHLHREIIGGITYMLNDLKLTAQVDVNHGDSIVIPPYVVYENQKYIVSDILENAFFGNIDITTVTIPASVGTIGKNAFAYCMGLRSLTCEASVPPVLDENVFMEVDHSACVLYVPAESIASYKAADGWKEFINIQPIQAEAAAVTAIQAEPTANSVVLEWPYVDGAATYSIEVKKGTAKICSLTFNENGQLVNIAFAAPARNGSSQPNYAIKSATGWQYTISGLDANTDYTYTVIAKKNDESVVYNNTIPFKTLEIATSLEITNDQSPITNKIIKDNQLFILRGDKVYTITGQEIK